MIKRCAVPFARHPHPRRLPVLLIALIALLLALPAAASAVTVAVNEVTGETNKAELRFLADPSEANHLVVSLAAEEGDFYDISLLESGAVLTPGNGCSGGGAIAVAVHCHLHMPAPARIEQCGKLCELPVSGTAWKTTMSYRLGDGGSYLDTSSLPAPAGTAGTPTEPIAITVEGGAGSDQIRTGVGDDTVRGGLGDDQVSTGSGNDTYLAEPTIDGADTVDLGPGIDKAVYDDRSEDLRFSDDALANDGAASEGDQLLSVEVFFAGSGNDQLELHHAGEGGASTALVGNAGNDVLRGAEGRDLLSGGEGDDQFYGGGGEDDLIDGGPYQAGGGNDIGNGEGGPDRIELGEGNDQAAGGDGEDSLYLGSGDDIGTGGTGNDLVIGEAGNDQIAGEDGNDRLIGGEGIDQLIGGDGADALIAGTIPTQLWSPSFLYSPGPVENVGDQVDCGPGNDRAGLDSFDKARRCEGKVLLTRLELDFPPLTSISRGQLSAGLRYEVRSPGRVSLSGSGLKPRSRTDNGAAKEAPSIVPIVLTGWAQRRFNRLGAVRLKARIVFKPSSGRSITRTRTIHLSKMPPA